MPPLVTLVLVGFLFLVALCLAIWAALTLGDRTRRYVPNPSRAKTGPERVAYVPMNQAQQPVWRSGSLQTSGPLQASGAQHGGRAQPPGASQLRNAAVPEEPARPAASNDDFRGARAVVTPRPVTEDAFERFLENENNGRR